MKRKNVMFGITHELGEHGEVIPIISEAKQLKVGIGVPKGLAIHVFIDDDRKWKIALGYGKDSTKVYAFVTMAEAEAFYSEQRPKAPVCPHPRKLSYFTFTKPTADGSMIHDFPAIEAHGPKPTEIDILFLGESPFDVSYARWSKTQLECSGDGYEAMQIPKIAVTEENKRKGEAALAKGEKYFHVESPCFRTGCPYAGNSCKPHGDLKFQLARKLRVGVTAYWHTTGHKSCRQVFSALEVFRGLRDDGRLSGAVYKMAMRPYQTNHNGQPGTQYGVSLEFRADDLEALQKSFIEQTSIFRAAMAPAKQKLAGGAAPALPKPTRELAAPAAAPATPADDDLSETEDDGDELRARTITDEFEGGDDGDDGDEDGYTLAEDNAASLESKMDEQARQARAEEQHGQPVAAPAPSHPEGSAPKPVASHSHGPWADKEQMIAAFRQKEKELGEKDFWRVMGANGAADFDALTLNSQETLAAYRALKDEIEFRKPEQPAAPAQAPRKQPPIVLGGIGKKPSR